MDIFSTKERALIHLNTTHISAGEIRVYRYYSITGDVDSFVVIGVEDGVGPDCYQILSKRKNLIVCIDPDYYPDMNSLPDASTLIHGQIHVCNVSGIYYMVYIENLQRIVREINDNEVYYVEDFDTGYLYYLDRYVLKKLDDYFSKVYIDLSNTQALYEPGTYPETTLTVWKDNSDITGACRINIESIGCTAQYDSSRTIRLIGMTGTTAKVIVKAVYQGNTYKETWNIQRVKEGPKGLDAEVYTILSKNSYIRESDMPSTEFQVLYQSGTLIDYFNVDQLESEGLRLTYEYSDGDSGEILLGPDEDFEFKSRINLDGSEVTYCTIKLLNRDSEILNTLTLPYLPNTNSITNGQGIYKATVFLRSNTQPDRPIGGSWDNPVPIEGPWSQTIPEGTDIIWASTRIFTSNGKAPQDPDWSYPTMISSTENLEVQYSTCQDATLVGTPSTRPENWSRVVTGIAYFMATRTIVNGVPGLWQVFAIHGKDGRAGNFKNFIYKNCIEKPATPVGKNPDGWQDYPDTEGIWWMSMAEFSGETGEPVTPWSNPVKVTGIDGDTGHDGPYVVYQYSESQSVSDPPTTGWSYAIPTVPKGHYLWQRSGTVYPPAKNPEYWNAPVRVTGERGEQGAPGTSVTIDLTNEVSSVPADYQGNVNSELVTFEKTQVLLYENGERINLAEDPNVKSLTITTDGVVASISDSGEVTVTSWTAPIEQTMSTVVIRVEYRYGVYTAVYSIQKIKAGRPGANAIIYSIIPTSQVIRKVGGEYKPEVLKVTIRKTEGSDVQDITGRFDSNDLELNYTINNSVEHSYDESNGIKVKDYTEQDPISGTEEKKSIDSITIILRKRNNPNVVLDKETIMVVEGTVDLVADLTNEATVIAANEDGTIPGDAIFEESILQVYYGSTSISIFDPELSVEAIWTNVTGEFYKDTDLKVGIIQPSDWDPEKLNETSGTVELIVTYREFTKIVTYSITKLNKGENAVFYRLIPNTSVVKVLDFDSRVSVDILTCDIYKHSGKSREKLNGTPLELRESEGIELTYLRRYREESRETSDRTPLIYDGGVGVTSEMEEITFELTDIPTRQVLDKESIPVVRDGTNARAITVDLTNESTSVPASSDGKVDKNVNIESTTLIIYENGKQLPIYDPRVNVNLDCSGVKAQLGIDGKITIVKGSWDVPDDGNSASILITTTVYEDYERNGGIKYKCTYNITKVRAGEDAVLYRLVPDASAIKISKDEQTSVKRLKCGVYKVIGTGGKTVSPGEFSNEGIGLYYRCYRVNSYTNTEEVYSADGVEITSDISRVEFILKNISKPNRPIELDKETIHSVRDGSDAKIITIDLSNENSSVPADYEGNVLEGTRVEPTTLLIHRNNRLLGLNEVESCEIVPNGVILNRDINNRGYLDGIVWDGTPSQNYATVTFKVTVDSVEYTTIYNITKVKAGAAGESPVIYSLVPSTNIIRKFNGVLSTSFLTVGVHKTVGSKTTQIFPSQDNLTLEYITNTYSSQPLPYPSDGGGIPINDDTEFVQVILKDPNGEVLDRETIVVLETAIDLVIDLTNEASSVTAKSDGTVTSPFETSTLQIFYGSEPVSIRSSSSTDQYNDGNIGYYEDANLTTKITWTGVKGTFINGVIKPTEWVDEDSDTASVVVEVSYEDFTKTVTYSLTRVRAGANGESPVIWSIIPDVGCIQGFEDSTTGEKSLSTDRIDVTVYQIQGSSRTQIAIEDLKDNGVILTYSLKGRNIRPVEGNYQNYISFDYGTDEIDVVLRDKNNQNIILDRETIPVIYNGTDAYNVILDLTNESSSIIASYEGEPKGEIEGTTIKFRVNKKELSISELGTNNITILQNDHLKYESLNSITGTISGIKWKEDDYGYDTGSLEIQVKYKDIIYTKIYSVTKVRMSKDGKSPVLYSIIPSVNSIKVSDSSQTLPNLTVSINEHTSEGTRVLNPEEYSSKELQVVYWIDNNTSIQPYKSEGIKVTPSNTQVIVAVRNKTGEVTYDKETIPVVHDGIAGKASDWKDYIFCESDNTPRQPSFTKHPENITNGARDFNQVWYDGPTHSSNNWWMSVATIDGETGEVKGSWSDPVRVTGVDGMGYLCEYTISPNLVSPPVGNSWSKTIPGNPTGDNYLWMRMKGEKEDDSKWNYMRITGERGQNGDSIIVKGDLRYVGVETGSFPSTISASEFSIIGSSAYNPSAPHPVSSYIGTLYQGPNPKSPIPFNGDCYLYDPFSGDPSKDGKPMFFICTGTTTVGNDILSVFQIVSIQGEKGDSYKTYIAYADHENPTNLNDIHETWQEGDIWLGVAIVNTDDYPVWIPNPNPGWKWSKFGGEDGIGQEFVFTTTNSDLDVPNLLEVTYTIGTGQSQKTFRPEDDEYLPKFGDGTNDRWTDNPIEVEDTDGKRVQWVSKRTKTKGTWGSFSTPPVVWNRYTRDGTSIQIEGKLDNIVGLVAEVLSTDKNYIITKTIDGYNEGDSEIEGTLFLERNMQAPSTVKNGATYSYNGNLVICTGVVTSGSNTYNSWYITNIKGEKGENAYLHVFYAEDNEGTNPTTEWSSNKYYFKVISTNSQTAPNNPNADEYLHIPWVRFVGQDGPGQEFIFTSEDPSTKTYKVDQISTSYTYTDPETGLKYDFRKDEFLPVPSSNYGIWEDDPIAVGPDTPVVWVSQRKKTNGTWGKFSVPVVWSRYAKDGTGLDVKGPLDFVGRQSSLLSSHKNYIIDNSYTHRVSTSVHGRLYIDRAEKTDVNNGDSYSYDGYLFVCTGKSGSPVIPDWSVMKASGEDGKSSYVFIRYSNTGKNNLVLNDMSETWNGHKYIGFAVSDTENSEPNKSSFTWCDFLGQDGVGQEFIFCLSDSLTTEMEAISGIDTNYTYTGGETTVSQGGKNFQEDEFLPGTDYNGGVNKENRWTDDPEGIKESPGKRKQWISTRKKINGTWGSFSPPVLWSEVPGTAYNLVLGNQHLEAVYGGEGVWWTENAPSPDSTSEIIYNSIKAGNCAGTYVKYLKGSALVTTKFTIEISSSISIASVDVYLLINGNWISHQFNNQDPWSPWTDNPTLGKVSEIEIFTKCELKLVDSWSVNIATEENVKKTFTVTRASFNPTISLGISSYGYNQDEHDNITYSPAKDSTIPISYLHNGKPVELSKFNNYNYYVYGKYSTSNNWLKVSGNVSLKTYVGEANPSDGYLEFIVVKNLLSGTTPPGTIEDISTNFTNYETYSRATIPIVASADLESVKTYLLDGNAAITGHVWAKDGFIGNWIINSTNTSLSDVSYSNGVLVAPYNNDYPVGSLRCINGNIVFDPDNGTNHWGAGIWFDYRDNNGRDHILANGTGALAHGHLIWDDEGNLSLEGTITANAGIIGKWSLYNGFLYSAEVQDGNTVDFSNNNWDETTSYGGIWLLPQYEISGNTYSEPSIKLIGDKLDGGDRNRILDISLDGIDFKIPSTAAENGYIIDKIHTDGSGQLAHGNLMWDEGGNLELTGKITATEGSIGGWTISSTGIEYYRTSENHIKLDTSTSSINLYKTFVNTGHTPKNYEINITTGTDPYKIDSGIFCHDRTPGSLSTAILTAEGFQIFNDGNATNWVDPVVNSFVPISLNADGSGKLANGNITWDSEGNLTIGSVKEVDEIYSYSFGLSSSILRMAGAGGYDRGGFFVDIDNMHLSFGKAYKTGGFGFDVSLSGVLTNLPILGTSLYLHNSGIAGYYTSVVGQDGFYIYNNIHNFLDNNDIITSDNEPYPTKYEKDSITINGQTGITRDITIGGTTLHIKGGIIVGIS